jgi:glutamate-1-semialdehyde 2,1-aminomutase
MNNRYKLSNKMIKDALEIIPLGSQTFSKSIASYPRGISPLFIKKGYGSHVWDVDDNEYIDFVNGLASVTLGYNDSEVNASIVKQLTNGITFSLPHDLEVQIAKLIIEMVPSAEMVRFGKNGTDATSASIRLARAYTGREHVAVCGYHGWQDWYIGSTARDLGVPSGVKELTHTFLYNNIESLEKIFKKLPNKVAAVIMEPMNINWPIDNFLHKVEYLCRKYKTLFILDETITGFRYSKGGAQEIFDITPDITTFGKGMGNGMPISAVVGKKEVMKLMDDIFFSGTFGGETLSLAAAKSVLKKIRDGDVIQKIHQTGSKVLDKVGQLIELHNVTDIISISGHPAITYITIKPAYGYSNYEIKTFFLQEMFKRGILILGSHNISYAHNDDDINSLLMAYNEVFPLIRKTLVDGTLGDYLEVEPLVPLFKIR